MKNYAIVGGGRLARHFSEYFRLLEIPHSCWTRDRWSPFNTFDLPDAGQRLKETVGDADRVLLLVSDNAIIAALLKQYPFLHEKQLIHCSGSMSIPGVAGAHPLMTFAATVRTRYLSKDAIHARNGSDFAALFPGLPNPHFEINVEDKARYHAMCVMAGNFSQVIVAKVFQSGLNSSLNCLQRLYVPIFNR